jgi:3-methyl-2-oxobutanoate hydroxymethyltransferase
MEKITSSKIAMLTCYNYPVARLLDDTGLDYLLVGDSLGMVELGLPDTTEVTMEHMLHHTAAVARGAARTPIIADLPFRSYETSEAAVKNATALRDAGAYGVKLEGGEAVLPQVRAIRASGIPVMGHLGMLPQKIREEGGRYRVKGKDPTQASQLEADAVALEKAGAFAVVLELVTAPVASQITSLLRIPTIGIGSGGGCAGQVLVLHDLIGLSPWFRPSFVVPKADVAELVRSAATAFVDETKKVNR